MCTTRVSNVGQPTEALTIAAFTAMIDFLKPITMTGELPSKSFFASKHSIKSAFAPRAGYEILDGEIGIF